MNLAPLIRKKKQGLAFTREEIHAFVRAVCDEQTPDYQLSALLMAICWRGMNDAETADLTLEMALSGDTVDLSDIPGTCVDKHSTGGVGDTTSLVLVPLVAACGVPVAKMSGRGLGHTGGTIDKLESIPGMRTELDEAAFKEQVRAIGCAVIGQSAALAPADKRLYALRDVTETVDSLPLIASSIMSKKIAAGCQAIVLDVKTGSGSFLPRLQDSVNLANAMVRIGSLVKRRTVALITDMGQPLGTHIGNALEVKEAIDILTGKAQGPLLEVSLTLGACMLQAAGKAEDLEQAKALLLRKLQSGQGAEKLRQMIQAQGGNPEVVDRTGLLPQASLQREYLAARGGVLTHLDAALLGTASQQLGAGRARKEDVIDPAVGLVLHKRLGESVRAGEPILTLYANRAERCEAALATLDRAVSIGEGPADVPPLIAARVDADGVHTLS